jgi:ribonuclease R
MLDNTCEGLVPIDDMPGYFVFDEKNLSLRSGDMSYRVGDSVTVRLEESDLVKCKLRFSIIL